MTTLKELEKNVWYRLVKMLYLVPAAFIVSTTVFIWITGGFDNMDEACTTLAVEGFIFFVIHYAVLYIFGGQEAVFGGADD